MDRFGLKQADVVRRFLLMGFEEAEQEQEDDGAPTRAERKWKS